MVWNKRSGGTFRPRWGTSGTRSPCLSPPGTAQSCVRWTRRAAHCPTLRVGRRGALPLCAWAQAGSQVTEPTARSSVASCLACACDREALVSRFGDSGTRESRERSLQASRAFDAQVLRAILRHHRAINQQQCTYNCSAPRTPKSCNIVTNGYPLVLSLSR